MNEFENDLTIPKEILELIFPNVDEVMNEYFETENLNDNFNSWN